jgi:hypothetical protein
MFSILITFLGLFLLSMSWLSLNYTTIILAASSIILASKKAIGDTVHKLITGAAATTLMGKTLHDYTKGNGGGNNSGDNNDKDKNKSKDNKGDGKTILMTLQKVMTVKVNKRVDYNYSFLLPLILSYLDINIPENATPLVNYSFNVFVLSLIVLLSFLNVVGYLTSIILLNKYEVEAKFPKLKKIINYYNKSSLLLVFIEGFICIIFLLVLIISSLTFLGVIIYK